MLKKGTLFATSLLLAGCWSTESYYEPMGPQYEPLARERVTAPKPVTTREVSTNKAAIERDTTTASPTVKSLPAEPAMDRPVPAVDDMPMIQAPSTIDPTAGPPTM